MLLRAAVYAVSICQINKSTTNSTQA